MCVYWKTKASGHGWRGKPEESMSSVSAAELLKLRESRQGQSEEVKAIFLSEPHDLQYSVEHHVGTMDSQTPKNLTVDRPRDSSSRWTVNLLVHDRQALLRLKQPAILSLATFGKCTRTMTNPLRAFRIFLGMSPDNMTEVLHGALSADPQPETFRLQSAINTDIVPALFVKLVPVSTWGGTGTTSVSVCYLRLHGYTSAAQIAAVEREMCKKYEQEALTKTFQYLRQRGQMGALETLLNTSGVRMEDLEDEAISKLFRAVVEDLDVDAAKSALEDSERRGLFTQFLCTRQSKMNWYRMLPRDDAHFACYAFSDRSLQPRSSRTSKLISESSKAIKKAQSAHLYPSARGGHQMVFSEKRQKIYMFGGWDGTKDLSDLWTYTSNGAWSQVMPDTAACDGPSARSCHKCCVDDEHDRIYVLGRYLDQQSRIGDNVHGDFYYYDLNTNSWTCLSRNTRADGGPALIYDHQMAMDTEKQHIYVFGGRTIEQHAVVDESDTRYSGMFRYDVLKGTWTELKTVCEDPGSVASTRKSRVVMNSRIGHSMLFDPVMRRLYVFAGQRKKDYLADFYMMDVDSEQLYLLSNDCSLCGGPDPVFTQRATIDPKTREIFVFSGLMRPREDRESVKNSAWIYSMEENKWRCVYRNDNDDPSYWKDMVLREPCPRFAHQIVYNMKLQRHLLFGGNPGDLSNDDSRLDDFWVMERNLLSPKHVLSKALFMVYKLRYLESCLTANGDFSKPMAFLRNDLITMAERENVSDPAEIRLLGAAMFTLARPFALELIENGQSHSAFAGKDDARSAVSFQSHLDAIGSVFGDVGDPVKKLRLSYFAQLMAFFPSSMKPELSSTLPASYASHRRTNKLLL